MTHRARAGLSVAHFLTDRGDLRVNFRMSALRRSIANANNDVISTQYYTQKINEYEWPPDVSQRHFFIILNKKKDSISFKNQIREERNQFVIF